MCSNGCRCRPGTRMCRHTLNFRQLLQRCLRPIRHPAGRWHGEARAASQGDETLGISGARLGTGPQPAQGFARGNSNLFVPTVPRARQGRGGHTRTANSRRAAHRFGRFGLHMGPGTSEDNFKVAQAVGYLVQQCACSKCFFKAEIV